MVSLAEIDLARSGLSLDDADRYGIETLSPEETKKLQPKHNREALKLNYYDAAGELRPEIYRLRLLGKEPPGPFGGVAEKPIRYLQPADTPPAAYFPRGLPWDKIITDTATTIILTEGEKKAACAAKCGYACIGLGGVYSFRSAPRGWPLLPELEAIEWTGRDVVICYDSDYATNPSVLQAISSLVKVLTQRGARPRVANIIDPVAGSKTGLDDLVVNEGLTALETVLEEAQGDALAMALWDFNAKFSMVLTPGFVYDESKSVKYAARDFTGSLYGNVWANQEEIDKNGTAKLKLKQVAPEWLKWPARRQYLRQTYAPGQGRDVGTDMLNSWPGWGCEARQGSVAPWQELLATLFNNVSEETRHWFEAWCLYPIARPGIKLQHCAAIWSHQTGIGKSLVGMTLGRVYGKNYTAISQDELDGSFNGWSVGQQLVMVDDITGHDSRNKADRLKTLITQEEITINTKYIPTYKIPDVINYYMTSNRSNAFYVEEHNRRHFIHEASCRKLEPAFFDNYHAWLSGGGPSALLHYAREFDFGNYSPVRPPPMTSAKADMIESVKSEADAWITVLKESPDSVLRTGRVQLDRDIFTARELLALFELEASGRLPTINTFGAKLRAVFDYVNDGKKMKVGDQVSRAYIIRNRNKWINATPGEIGLHIRKTYR